jgi:hypothetical protein
MSSDTMLDQLVREVAEHCFGDAQSRLSADWWRMDAAEMRGYVRARVYSDVRRCVTQATADCRLSHVAAEDLLARALERTTQLIVRQRPARPQAAETYPPPRLRRAG